MFRHQFFNTVTAKAVVGWVATVGLSGGFSDPAGGLGVARASFSLEDPLRDDQGWVAWNSKYAFSDKGMIPFGVVTREFFKERPSEFDAAVTIDASENYFWGFGIAGHYSPETGYSGIGLTAGGDAEIGVMFARWEHDSIVDMVRIDADPARMLNGVHRVGISVRDDVAYAAIDDQIVGKIAYGAKFGGSQIVLASFSNGDTYFRDLSIASTIPTPGTAAIIGVAGMMVMGGRRRR